MTVAPHVPHPQRRLDPVLLAVLANRFDAIVREMSNTLLRTARSGVIAVARDFSCALVTGDNRLLTSAEGLPVHIFGSHLQCESMCEMHPDLAEGDAFLHNDPYLGNSHPADHTILVPVFVDGEHVFTACAKAHQADIGNALPTTYMAGARDVYEEGGLIFPCVRIQRDGRDVDDVIRMCRQRIRVPDQWYGDYLAALGAARIAERRLEEVAAKYGVGTLREFIEEWFDYSERRMVEAIRKLPAGRLRNQTAHDPFPPILPEGIPLRVEIDVDPEAARIRIDLRDNVDCVDCGFNQSVACSQNNVISGVFNCLDPDLPHNAGSFRRIEVLLRENCVVGIPRFPHSCSMATTNVADRLVNVTQSAFAQIGDGYGLAEGGSAMGVGAAVVSGADWRRGGAPYINQLLLGNNGGPASPRTDGWLTYGIPVVSGLMYRDSIEIDEIKHPLLVRSLRLQPGSGGAGRFRGALGAQLVFGPRRDPIRVVIPCDGQHNPPRGVRGGEPGRLAETWKVERDGAQTRLPNVVELTLEPGEWIRGEDNGGGGYGDPLARDPARVLHDVLEGWETTERARDVYGVVLEGTVADESLAVDEAASTARRAELAAARSAGAGS